MGHYLSCLFSWFVGGPVIVFSYCNRPFSNLCLVKKTYLSIFLYDYVHTCLCVVDFTGDV